MVAFQWSKPGLDWYHVYVALMVLESIEWERAEFLLTGEFTCFQVY